MTRSDDDRLVDIIEACGEISALVARGRDQFGRDRAVQLAIERLLEIIGESSRSLSQETTARFNTVDWRSITQLRVVLAHHYHRVDPELVWMMATHEVPELERQLTSSGS